MSLLVLNLVLAFSPSLVCHTSTRHVTGMTLDGDGAAWVSTWGGLLRRDRSGSWQKFTAADGLLSNELTNVEWASGQIQVSSPQADFVWPSRERPLEHIRVSSVPAQVPPGFPGLAGEVTCSLPGLIGTLHDGLWEEKDGHWQRVVLNEPGGQDIQSLAQFEGRIYSATLSDGLDVFHKDKWTAQPDPRPPRSLIPHGDTLYLLRSDGTVDRIKKAATTRNVFSALPRKEARALASDGTTLFVAEWGGWSSLRGSTWTHVLDVPQLSGARTTCLLPVKDSLYIGTQGRGLAIVDLKSKSVKWIDERAGLKDDWITTLAVFDEKVYAGTFIGGLFEISGINGHTVPGTEGQNVTSLAEHQGALWVGTRSGLGVLKGGSFVRTENAALSTTEVQALLSDKDRLWIGTRCGLFQWTMNKRDLGQILGH